MNYKIYYNIIIVVASSIIGRYHNLLGIMTITNISNIRTQIKNNTKIKT